MRIKDFALMVSAAVLAIAVVVGLLWLLSGEQPTRAELLTEIRQLQDQQSVIIELLDP